MSGNQIRDMPGVFDAAGTLIGFVNLKGQEQALGTGSGDVVRGNNLSDLPDPDLARTNLGAAAATALVATNNALDTLQAVVEALPDTGLDTAALAAIDLVGLNPSVAAVAGTASSAATAAASAASAAAAAATTASGASSTASSAASTASAASSAASSATSAAAAAGAAAASAVAGVANKADGGRTITYAGTGRSLATTDKGNTIRCTSSADVTFTVPTGLGADFNCSFIQRGSGNVTLSGPSTLDASPGLSTGGVGKLMVMVPDGADAYTVLTETSAQTFKTINGQAITGTGNIDIAAETSWLGTFSSGGSGLGAVQTFTPVAGLSGTIVWKRDGATISGATSLTYALVDADLGGKTVIPVFTPTTFTAGSVITASGVLMEDGFSGADSSISGRTPDISNAEGALWGGAGSCNGSFNAWGNSGGGAYILTSRKDYTLEVTMQMADDRFCDIYVRGADMDNSYRVRVAAASNTLGLPVIDVLKVTAGVNGPSLGTASPSSAWSFFHFWTLRLVMKLDDTMDVHVFSVADGVDPITVLTGVPISGLGFAFRLAPSGGDDAFYDHVKVTA